MLNEFQEERELLDLKNLQEQVLESGGVAGMLEQLGHRLDLDDLVDWRERASGSETDPTMSLGKLLLLLILSRVEQRDVVDLKVPLLDRFPAQRLQPIAVLLYRRLRSIDHQGTRISWFRPSPDLQLACPAHNLFPFPGSLNVVHPEDGPSHGDFPVGRRVVEGLDGG